jgi:hypothetical protein
MSTLVQPKPAPLEVPTELDQSGFVSGRIRATEIHEQTWFPAALRNYVTDGLQFILGFGNIYQPIAQRLGRAVRKTGPRQITDLCSGGGGPWPWLQRPLKREIPTALEIYLTDKFPNLEAIKRTRKKPCEAIHYCSESIDATNIPQELHGFRTMFSSFHHFSPDEAVAVLQNAVDGREGIAIFEAARRRPLNILLTLLMPIGAFLSAPFIRPLQASRFFWTYVIPVVPFVLWFDGVLSCLRAYSPEELSELVRKVDADGYTWEIGEERGWLGPVTYLVGYPI